LTSTISWREKRRQTTAGEVLRLSMDGKVGDHCVKSAKVLAGGGTAEKRCRGCP
jgi:hypothetical protein